MNKYLKLVLTLFALYLIAFLFGWSSANPELRAALEQRIAVSGLECRKSSGMLEECSARLVASTPEAALSAAIAALESLESGVISLRAEVPVTFGGKVEIVARRSYGGSASGSIEKPKPVAEPLRIDPTSRPRGGLSPHEPVAATEKKVYRNAESLELLIGEIPELTLGTCIGDSRQACTASLNAESREAALKVANTTLHSTAYVGDVLELAVTFPDGSRDILIATRGLNNIYAYDAFFLSDDPGRSIYDELRASNRNYATGNPADLYRQPGENTRGSRTTASSLVLNVECVFTDDIQRKSDGGSVFTSRMDCTDNGVPFLSTECRLVDGIQHLPGGGTKVSSRMDCW